ncbi:MAG: class I SAM-dependent methyltransferase [Candidatus Latescibacterota bacterium]
MLARLHPFVKPNKSRWPVEKPVEKTRLLMLVCDPLTPKRANDPEMETMKKYPEFIERYHEKVVKEIYTLKNQGARYVKADDIVLDAGCGEKSFVKTWQPQTKLTVGTDLWEESIQRNKTVDLRAVADLDYIPFLDEIFDVIICDSVMEHVNHPATIYEEFYRVLKKNGTLIVRTNSIYNPFMVINRILPIKVRNMIKDLFRIPYGATFPAPYRCNTLRKTHSLLTRIGFKKVSAWRFGAILVRYGSPLYLFFLLYEKITDFKPLRGMKAEFEVCYTKED